MVLPVPSETNTLWPPTVNLVDAVIDVPCTVAATDTPLLLLGVELAVYTVCATPWVSVTTVAKDKEPPVMSVSWKSTFLPLTRFPAASRTIAVMVLWPVVAIVSGLA